MAYSLEIKQKAIDYWERCNDIEQVMKAYGVSRSTLFIWKQRKKQTGSLVSPPVVRKPRKIDRDKLKAYVEQNPDAYLVEIAEQFNCTAPAIFYALKAIGITYKKRQRPTKSKTQ